MSPIPMTPREYVVPLLQRAWVQRVLPVGASVLLHGGLVVFALVALRAVQTIREPLAREQIVVPSSDVGPTVGAVPNPGLGVELNRTRAQDQLSNPEQKTTGWSTQASPTLSSTMLNTDAGPSANRVAIGPNSAVGPSGSQSGSGGPSGQGPFGPASLGGPPGAPFLNLPPGTHSNAYKVIYICDGSGSMLSLRGLLAQELRKSIDGLKASQAFNVIIFQNEQPLSVSDSTLLVANAASKSRAFKFLDTLPASGQTNPIPALELALKQKPELIYLLTDGQFDNVRSYSEVLDYLRTANRDKRVRINTLLLNSTQLSEALDVVDEQAADTLKQIAKENGGVFSRVSSDQLK